MSSGDVRRAIEVQTEALGPVLYAGAATALTASRKRRRGLAHERYPHLLPLLMRVEMREFLEENPLPNGWVVGGDSTKMGQLLLHQPDLNLQMRFLKERRRTYPGGVPVAGRNPSRREDWIAEPFDFALPAGSNTPGSVRLLLLWDFLSRRDLKRFSLRIVHTLTPGVYGKAVPCDLILDVNDGGEIFKRLEFTGAPQDRDFFAVEIAEEDGDGGS